MLRTRIYFILLVFFWFRLAGGGKRLASCLEFLNMVVDVIRTPAKQYFICGYSERHSYVRHSLRYQR